MHLGALLAIWRSATGIDEGDVIREICAGFINVSREIAGYWRRYGGLRKLLTSPFFVSAIALTLVCTPYWWGAEWWALSSTVIPALLGFSVAAFALLLSIGDDKFKIMFGRSYSDGSDSLLCSISTAFFHFIVVQVLALALAFMGGARIMSGILGVLSGVAIPEFLSVSFVIAAKAFRFVGFFFVAYSLMTAFAAALAIYKLSLAYTRHANGQPRAGAAPESPGATAGSAPARD